ncbi:MAG TPA: hypothetical protein VN743_14225 [Blastocatellia bacterium]|nr:hypothetical protein [Blastocatellia bacterium]
MTTSKSKWIAGVIFWILFLVSLALNARYRWINLIWSIALWLGLLGTSIYFVARAFHNRTLSGTAGFPRWFLRFAFDEDERGEQDGPKARTDAKSR